MPGTLRLRRWVDGIVFERKDPGFLEMELALQAEVGAADDENDRELEAYLAAAAADMPVANSRSLSQGPSFSSASRRTDSHPSPSHDIVAQHIPPETPPTSFLASPVVISRASSSSGEPSLRSAPAPGSQHSSRALPLSSQTKRPAAALSLSATSAKSASSSRARVSAPIIMPRMSDLSDDNEDDDDTPAVAAYIQDVDTDLAALQLTDRLVAREEHAEVDFEDPPPAEPRARSKAPSRLQAGAAAKAKKSAVDAMEVEVEVDQQVPAKAKAKPKPKPRAKAAVAEAPTPPAAGGRVTRASSKAT